MQVVGVYASTQASNLETSNLIVKTINDDHEDCTHTSKNGNFIEKWLKNRYMVRIRVNNHIGIKELRQIIDKDYSLMITRPQAYRARSIALAEIRGMDEVEYGEI